MAESLNVNEIYLSLQGESTFAGLPCVFVRLTACHLRCSYCDSTYAFTEGKRMPLDDILKRIADLSHPYAKTATKQRLPLVELTGGEPLLQASSLSLMRILCENGYRVLLETSGALDISGVDRRVHRIMDLKCPSSGEEHQNRWDNLPLLTSQDELKFVIGSCEDYQWARNMVLKESLADRCSVLFSWAAPIRHLSPEAPASIKGISLKSFPASHTPFSQQELADHIIADALPIRFQVQMHKVIWPAEKRGV